MRPARQVDPPASPRDPARETPESGDASSRAALGFYLTQGFSLAAVMLAFTGLGYWLDGRLHTLPLLTLVGAAAGGVGGFVNLYRSVVATRPGRDRAR